MRFFSHAIILIGVLALVLASACALWLWSQTSSAYIPPPFVADVQRQTLKEGGEDLIVTGRGFDAQTRAALVLDSGNRQAIVGSLKSASSIRRIVPRDGLVFMANAHLGVQVVDLADPASPRIIGSEQDSFESAWDIELAGPHALVADVRRGLIILDVGRPSHPRKIGQLPADGYKSWGVAMLSEAIALVAQGTDGLAVVDVVDRKRPKVIARIPSLGFSWDAQVDGRLVYLSDGNAGMRVFDLSEPAHPRPVGRYETFGHLRDLAFIDEMAFLADSTNGLTVLDISNPAAPRRMAHLPELGKLWQVRAADNKIYVAGSTRGMLEIDVTDPSRPLLTGQLVMPGHVQALGATDEHALISDGIYGLQVVRRDRLRPTQAALKIPALGRSYSLAHNGDYLAVAEKDEGLRFFRKNGTDSVRFLERTGGSPTLRSLDSRGDLLWMAVGSQGLQSFRLARSDLLQWVGALKTPHDINLVKLFDSGRKALAAVGSGGVLVVDISDPAAPKTIRRFLHGDQVVDLLIRDNQALVLERGGRLTVLDLSAPVLPRVVEVLALPGPVNGMWRVGEILCVTGSASGMTLVDISNSAAPSVKHNLLAQDYVRALWADDDHLLVRAVNLDKKQKVPAFAGDLVLFGRGRSDQLSEIKRTPAPGSIACAAAGSSALYLADRSGVLWGTEKASLVELAFVKTAETDMHFSNLYAVGDRLWGRMAESFKVFDIQEPLSPKRQPVAVESYWDVVDVSWRDDTLVILDVSSGLHSYRIGDSGMPQLLGSLGLRGSITSWAMDGSLGYALGSSGTLKIVDLTDPLNLQLKASLDLGGKRQTLAVRDGFALVASGTDGIQMWDLREPARARVIGELQLPWPESEFIQTHDVWWREDLAVIAAGPAGVLILDLSDLRRPQIVGRFQGPSYCSKVWGHKDMAYVGTQKHGLMVLDMKQPARPTLMGTLETRGQVRDLIFDPPFVWLALDSSGVVVVPMLLEAEQVEVQANGQFRARFPELPMPGNYTLHVYSPYGTHIVEGAIKNQTR